MYRTLVLLSLAATVAVAQQPCRTGQPAPDLGYGFLTCHDCLSSVVINGHNVLRFSGQPAIFKVRADGPAAGKLADGDTLLSVNGQAITTDAAALALARWQPGTMSLGVKRNGTTSTVSIVPTAVCISTPPLTAAQIVDSLRAQIADRLATLNTLTARLRAAKDSTQGLAALRAAMKANSDALAALTGDRIGGTLAWSVSPTWGALDPVATDKYYFKDPKTISKDFTFDYISPIYLEWRNKNLDFRKRTPGFFADSTQHLGLTLSCTLCRGAATLGASWTFGERPTVASVEAGGFADLVGLRRGDLLVSIDGNALTTPAGSNRMSLARPGDRVTIAWERGTERLTRTAVIPGRAGLRPLQPLNTTQQVGNASVEVRGTGASWSRDPVTGEVRVTTDSVTVIITPPRVRPDTTARRGG